VAKRAIPAIKKYVVTLSGEERALLTTIIQSGKHPAFKLLRARILLKADSSEAGDGWSDSQIAEALDTSVDTVVRTRQRWVEEGFETALIPGLFSSQIKLRIPSTTLRSRAARQRALRTFSPPSALIKL
jgi:hypothetical protein